MTVRWSDESATRQSHLLRVAQVIAETPDAISIAFDIAESIAAQFAYRAGQFLTLKVPSHETGSVARCYSLSSSPYTDRLPTVTVKRTTGGYASNWLCDNVTVGSELDILPPSGSFGPARYEGDLLLFAAGSGITPIMSITKSFLSQGHGHVMLLYANRDADSVIFARELERLQNNHPRRLTVKHWIEQRCGRPNAEALARVASTYPDRPAYACGPEGFMTVVRQGLRTAAPNCVLHTETFVSLTRNPFEHQSPDEPQVCGPAHTALTVDVDGEQHDLMWPDDVSLLDLLKRNGIDVPFACEEGSCGSCACRVSQGAVKMRVNEALDEDDVAAGYVLACQAIPLGGDVRVHYD